MTERKTKIAKVTARRPSRKEITRRDATRRPAKQVQQPHHDTLAPTGMDQDPLR